MSGADRVKHRIQVLASTLAQERSVPSVRHARAIVSQILREEGNELPAGESVSSLADALLGLHAIA